MPTSPPRHARPSRTPAGKRGPKRRRSLGSIILGVLGELLSTLGVLGLLFVVWELWWTGIEAESDRQETLDEFYAAMPESPVAARSEERRVGEADRARMTRCYGR